jgi:hypothetical protein
VFTILGLNKKMAKSASEEDFKENFDRIIGVSELNEEKTQGFFNHENLNEYNIQFILNSNEFNQENNLPQKYEILIEDKKIVSVNIDRSIFYSVSSTFFLLILFSICSFFTYFGIKFFIAFKKDSEIKENLLQQTILLI